MLILTLLLAITADPVAIAENKQAARECQEKHDREKKKVGDLTRRGKITIKTTKSKYRFGGGAGYNGFGGMGGYAGYGTDIAAGGGGIGAMMYNFGYGYGNPGNARQEDHTETTEEREMIWPDRNYYGGPLTIRNPFK